MVRLLSLLLVLGAGAPRALALRGAAVAALQQEEQLALLDTARSEGCTYSAKSTLANCPATYTHTGVSCFRGHDTANKLGERPNRYCPDGYRDVGAFCDRTAKTLGFDHATCPEDRFRNGGRCYKKCIAGFTNMGETCTNWECVKVGWETYVQNPVMCKLGLEGSFLARAGELVLGSLRAVAVLVFAASAGR